MMFDSKMFYKELDKIRLSYVQELNRIGNHVPAHLSAVVPVIGLNSCIEVLAKIQVALKNSTEEEPTASEKKAEETVVPKRGRPSKEDKENEKPDA